MGGLRGDRGEDEAPIIPPVEPDFKPKAVRKSQQLMNA